MKRVLVTGGTGFLGRAVVARLGAGRVLAVGRNPVAGAENRAADLLDPASVRAALAPGDYDAVVHLAGPAPKGEQTWEAGVPLVEVHHALAANLAHGLPSGWSGRVVHTSGMIVYGLPERVPVDEAHPLRPLHLYGLAKRIAEDAWLASGRSDLWLVRLPGLFSEERRSGAVWSFARAAATGSPLRVSADRPTPWDLLHVDDAAAGIGAILDAEGPGPGPINLGYGAVVTLDSVAGWFARAVGGRVDPPAVEQPPFGLGIALASRRLAWPPCTLSSRLAAMLEAAR
jgi:UDP-glucose 4-epimerase